MNGDLQERGRATAKEAGRRVQSPGKPGKGLEEPAGRALQGAHWSVWLLGDGGKGIRVGVWLGSSERLLGRPHFKRADQS